jgi:hypothetical protein
MSDPIFFTTPVGRIVAGSLYKPNDKSFDGGKLTTKSGPNAGKERVEYFFALAIPKEPGKHWAATAWGEVIWRAGHAFMADASKRGDNFAWKVKDGDSPQPDKKGTPWNQKEGYPGHWVLHLSSGFAPKIYNKDGSALILEVDAVKPGYFVQVHASVNGNGNMQNPGVFLNHSLVSLQAYGPEIVVSGGPDVSTVGFGQNVQLPAGASAVPTAGFPAVQAPAAAPVAPVPGVPGAPTAAPPMPAAPSTAAAPSPQPYPGILGAPPAPGVVTPPMPPAAHVPQMLGAAAQIGYQAFKDRGWTDEQLRSAGHMA